MSGDWSPAPRADWVVVYGTLMRGHTNHHWLAGAPCQGRVRLPSLALHDLGPFPMAVPGPGSLIGELYRVEAATLHRLDHLEGVPRLYRRWRWRSIDGPWVWVYVGQPHQVRHSPHLPDGHWPGPRQGRRQDGDRDPP